MSNLDYNIFKPTKTGISLSNTFLAEALGIKPGDMVFAVSGSGRILLKRFSPSDLTDATDKAALGFVEESKTAQLDAPEPVLQEHSGVVAGEVQGITPAAESTGKPEDA